jgi:hypothetical protein
MSLVGTDKSQKNTGSKTVFRNTTRCLKLTEHEARLLDEVAAAKGVALVNVLRPLAAGQRIAPEAFDRLLDEIGSAKHELAGRLIAEGKR